MKPRQPGSVFDALVRFMTQIGDAAGSPGRGVEMAADFEGKTKWTLTHEIDPDDTKHRMSLLSASRLAAHYKVPALAEYFAALADGVFLPLPRIGSDGRWQQLTAEAVEDMGRLAAEIVRDLLDGKIDAVEAKRILPLVEEMQRHFAAMSSLLRGVIDGVSK